MRPLFAILLATAASTIVGGLTACTSDKIIEEVQDITESKDLMRFSGLNMDEEQAPASRAQQRPLTTGFAVSTYKAYNSPTQQTVMQDYRVDYRVDGWSNEAEWYYDNVTGYDGTQFLKYWDYAYFPYRFHAIAPCPKQKTDFTLSDHDLQLHTPFYYQTCIDGAITTRDAAQQATDANPEPHMIAQVHRKDDGTDYDLLARNLTNSGPRQINTNSTTRNREVWLPFHHLNAKIRFGIYSTNEWATHNHLYVEDLVVKFNSPNFVTTATDYTASVSSDLDSWRNLSGTSGFTSVTTTPTPLTTPLFQYTGGKEFPGNDLFEAQTRRTAYMFHCPDGFMQIPQTGLTATVSFRLMDNGTLYQEFVDYPVSLEDGTDHFDWISGYLHTYYIVIGGIPDKLKVTFTAVLAPWEDVSGELVTNLEQ